MFSGEVGARLVQHASAPNRERTRPFPELTERETEILAHIAAGRSNRDIAVSLFLAEKTVRNNVAMILAKLHLRDRAAAVAAARDHGLGAGR
ncbi:hypothetical protein GCM10025870_14990 [Agromyces marinus]|uniref:HTH luxR-type domain-containing protein n=1 Tax=Agromyces marinus TaxID=1389020 RepID=A0ABM8H126_9MICO|nr:LuxR C-terminal-related transcriptional regulator [Agromyces marinus]BDZ54426.1 hypothetical protein GCM10025870_14990 [Agromyces marinus]